MPGPVEFSKANLLAALSGAGEEPEGPAENQPPQQTRRATSLRKLAPKDIVKLAKARLKDVRAELRRMRALDKERLELERLIQAAEDTKPRLKKVAG